MAEAKKAETKKPDILDPNEEVEVKLFKDNGKYSKPLFVGVNGETIAIQRGEKVKIKRKFLEVIENSERQDYETALKIEAASDAKKLADM